MNRTASLSSTTFSRRLLAFLKDWGPVFTVLYAIIYTFPTEVFERFFENPAEHSLETARRTLADALAISDEWTKQSRSMGTAGPLDMDQTNNSYFYKLRISMDSGYAAIKRSANRFGVTELMMIGNLYGTSGDFDKSIEFLKLAKSRIGPNHFRYAGLFVNLGDSQFKSDDKHALAAARGDLLEGIRLFAEGRRRNYANQALYYFQSAAMLANDEAYFGDFKCAKDLANELNSTQIRFSGDLAIQQYMTGFLASQQVWVKLEHQTAEGCGYQLPELL